MEFILLMIQRTEKNFKFLMIIYYEEGDFIKLFIFIIYV